MASSTVGTAVIKLSFDGSDVKAELSKTSSDFKNAGEKAGSNFGTAMTVAMGSLISKGVSKLLNTITGNLDSAINRVDVINNFPKVMQSLGFSTEEAADSIKTISDRLDGLPTTLNGLVGDVQKLTATMGNLNTGMVNATSLGLALNDMFLAGGKGTEAASAAMEQYNQMLAQGKPDMQSWRSILNAAPGQLKQLAQTLLGAAASQNDLYVALQKGNITFDQMNEAIVKLDQQGGQGFDSFEKQARAATGGVGTALENVQNRISKAIAKVIDVIGADNIANAINGISSHFTEVGVEVGKFVKSAMGFIGELARFIGNNLWIVDTIKGAIASIIAIGIGQKIMELKNKLQLLFAAISAHPLIALATAIIGIATAIGSAASRETELTAAMNKSIDAYKDAKQSLDELHKSRQDTLDQGMSELSYYRNLMNELDKIVDENGKVKAGYQDRANFITGKLSEALGVEIQMHDGVIQSYKEIRSEIDKTIQKKQAELKLKAQEEAYTEAIKRRGEVSKRVADIESQIMEAMQSRDYNSIMKVPELTKTLDDEKALYREYSADIKAYLDDYAAFTEGRLDDINVSYWNNTYELAKAENATKDELEKAVRTVDIELSLIEKNFDLMGKETYETTRDSLIKTKNELLSRLNGMVSSASSVAGQFSAVGQKGGNAIASGFNSKSSTISSSVTGALNGAKNGSWGTAWNDGYSLGTRTGSAIVSGVASQQRPIISVGQMLMLGLRDGMNANAWNVVTSVASNFMNDFKSFFGIHSPSTLFRDEIGAMLARGLGIGFENEMESVTGDMAGSVPTSFGVPAYATNWSRGIESAIMEQSGTTVSTSNNINVYMNNTIDNDMSIDELGRKFSQSIRRYA